MNKCSKYLLVSLLVGLWPSLCFSQNALPSQIRIRQTMDGLSDLSGMTGNEMLYGVEVPPGRILGDYYLDAKWNKGSLLIYGSENVIDGYFVRYDIEGNAVEVKVGEQIKLLPISRIESLIWYDSITKAPHAFINAKEYKENGVPLTGLIEILEDGELPLVKKTTIWIKQPDYVVAFDVGSRDAKIYKRENFYLAKGKELIELKKKKEILTAMGDKGSEMENFAKVNHLNLKEERGLRGFFAHYNSLVKE